MSETDTSVGKVIQRVVLFSSTLNQTGGGDRLLLELARGLEAQNVETTIVVLDFHRRALFEGRFNPPRLIALGSPRPGIWGLFQWARMLWKTRQAILSARPHHIITQSENNAAFIRLALWSKAIPYSIHIFGQMYQFPHDLTKYARVFRRHLATIRDSMEGYRLTVPPEMPPRSALRKLANEAVAFARYHAVRNAHSCFVLSRQVAWETSLLYNRPGKVARGAYPESIFHAPPRERRQGTLLSLGRLVPKKNVHLAIEAFALIAHEDPSYRLMIGGTGSERDRLEELARTRGIANQVNFLGYVPEAELWTQYQSCAAFVMLDVADYNITLYEALALNTPVVVSCDQEIDSTLAGSPNVFATGLAVETIAAQMRAALQKPFSEPSAEHLEYLNRMSWENYARLILREISNAA